MSLTPSEYRLLEFLMRRHGAAVSRCSITEAVWGSNAKISDNNVDVFIRQLRKKVEVRGNHS